MNEGYFFLTIILPNGLYFVLTTKRLKKKEIEEGSEYDSKQTQSQYAQQ